MKVQRLLGQDGDWGLESFNKGALAVRGPLFLVFAILLSIYIL